MSSEILWRGLRRLLDRGEDRKAHRQRTVRQTAFGA